jgi:hypothetical protein
MTWLLIVITFAASVSAQVEQNKADKPVLTIKGCLDGGWLHVSSVDGVGGYTSRYRLRGNKRLLKELTSAHNGSLMEVTGAVTDTAKTVHRGKTVELGKKTAVRIGSKETPSVPDGDDPSIEVGSYRVLKDSCK